MNAKALLLRVGLDRGTGGALGPIYPDGTFEYIPIPETVLSSCPFTTTLYRREMGKCPSYVTNVTS